MVISIVTAFVLSLLFCPLVIAVCRKYNIYDEIDPRKIHTGQIPRLGGVALFAAFVIAVSVYLIFFKVSPTYFASPLYISGAIILVFGIVDDFLNLRARLKFVVQIIAAFIVASSPCYFTHLFLWQMPPIMGRVITFFWIIGIVNAFNLIDGMDWLCGGISFLTVLTLGIVFYLDGKNLYNVFFILCGAIAGFLYWNKPNAKIFLGDGGSQSLGYIIAVAPLFYPDMLYFKENQFLIMILLCSIPITDVIAAIWRRKREHRSFFSADRSHIHHKLLNVGFSKGAAIAFLLCLQLLVCFSVLTTYEMAYTPSRVVLLLVLAFVAMIFIVFHYLNRAVNLHHIGHLEDHPQKEH